MTRLVCVGDIMQDVSAVVSAPIYWGSDTVATVRSQGGGSAANVACWSAKSGFPTMMVGRVGSDFVGENLIRELEQYNIQTHIARDPKHRTGTVVLIVDGSGERTMFPDPGANTFLEVDDLPELHPDDVLFISGYAFLYEVTSLATQELVRRAKEMKLRIAVDPGSAGYIATGAQEQLIDLMLRSADVILANEDEARVMTGKADNWDACEALAERVGTAVVKVGARGAIAISGGERFEQPAEVVPLVVDTTGAGDAFAGGFLPTWAAGGSIQEALHAGVMTATTCVGLIGARP